MCVCVTLLCVCQVVNGPMDVVRTIDQMVTKISPQLMEEDDHLSIHRANISESSCPPSLSHTHT